MSNFQIAPTLEAHVARYAESHSNPTNQALHFAGIPILAVSVLGLLSKVADATGLPVSAPVVSAATGAWYARWDTRVAPLMAALAGGCYAAGRRFSTGQLLAMFGLGAALHAVGHFEFEGKPPAFLSRPVSVLEAPPWLFEMMVGHQIVGHHQDASLLTPPGAATGTG